MGNSDLKIIFVILLILGGYFVFDGIKANQEIKEQNKILIQKEKQLQELKQQLSIQQNKNTELQAEADSLLLLWKNRPKEVIVNEIKQKHNVTKNNIINADDDELLRLFSGILQEKE